VRCLGIDRATGGRRGVAQAIEALVVPDDRAVVNPGFQDLAQTGLLQRRAMGQRQCSQVGDDDERSLTGRQWVPAALVVLQNFRDSC